MSFTCFSLLWALFFLILKLSPYGGLFELTTLHHILTLKVELNSFNLTTNIIRTELPFNSSFSIPGISPQRAVCLACSVARIAVLLWV